MAGLASAMTSSGAGGSKQKINTKTLCDLIGSRYYQHNEEIEMSEDKIVRCFDENDQLLGEMSLRESQQAADGAGKDIVLRNAKINPPVVKIMNYKRELLKRLFKKLGKEMDEKDMKSKTIRLATTISYHDLENKKRQAKSFFKTH
jgi:translation initiation factor IF-3